MNSDDRRAIFTVSQLNREVGLLLQQGFGRIWVQGEISNLSVPRSGHWYLSLKDAGAQLRCAMFRNANRLVGQPPRDGDEVLVRGRLGLYEARGDFQLIIEHMEPAGEGALRLQFEALKQKLAAEGLFEPERKRSIPSNPTCLGIVTSATGAALRDIRAVLARRCPLIDVVVYPTLVQGDRAAAGVEDAIARANIHGDADVLIVSRGGGSLEDLWPFNEERVARAIVASRIPVISGVGHEVDTTITDLVADLRAPTPSAAAELAAPDLRERMAVLTSHAAQSQRALRALLAVRTREVTTLHHRVTLAHPGRHLEQRAQRVDELAERLQRLAYSRLQIAGQRLNALDSRLGGQHPRLGLQRAARHIDQLQTALTRATVRKLDDQRMRVGAMGRELEAVSPLAVLNRGFAVATNPEQQVIRSVSQVSAGDAIDLRLTDGVLRARVEATVPARNGTSGENVDGQS
ncbi:MAG: exodeoxyribonuclease VII large subunit [Xanthomonadales bacterium]|nr:exodeoxyribonuclease VII large subunit [Xanthomonadales bacterium]